MFQGLGDLVSEQPIGPSVEAGCRRWEDSGQGPPVTGPASG